MNFEKRFEGKIIKSFVTEPNRIYILFEDNDIFTFTAYENKLGADFVNLNKAIDCLKYLDKDNSDLSKEYFEYLKKEFE